MMTTLENGDKKYSQLISDIESGQIKIPQFQRQFVWDIKSSAKLIDSILKGYPIGTFIYWRTNERLRSIRNIGGIELPDPVEGEYVNYVLDGQQRITSLFATLKGEKVKRDKGKFEDFTNIYIDLDAEIEDNEDIVKVDISSNEDNTYVSVTDLINKNRRFFNKFPEKYDVKIDKYKEIIQSYQFKGVNLKDAEIDVATEVFTRINVGGKDLTLFEIMVAKTYDPKRNFDLFEEFNSLIDELREIKYETISSASLLQLVALLIDRECTRKAILRLEKDKFIDTWPIAVDCFKQAIDFFRSYGIPVSRILPYNAVLVPFAYFFNSHKGMPYGRTKELLEDFFWRVSLGFRYSSAVETKLAQDIEKIDKIIEGNHPRYDWIVNYSEEFLETNGYFGTSRSFIKAVLCIFTMWHPKSFLTNLEVNIDNSYLKIASSKNYHHFFPKAYMKKNYPELEYWEYNHIANITIVDADLNKNKIRAKAPSKYIADFASKNSAIKGSLKSHLIDDIAEFGVLDDDYELFFEKRCKAISDELRKRLILDKEEEQDNLISYEDLDGE